MSKKPFTVFIGRFSPFHLGHAAVLDRAIETSDAVLVLIGSSDQAPTTKNPFTFEQRKTMIESYLNVKNPNVEVMVRKLHDHPYNDNEWIRCVQNEVEKTRAFLRMCKQSDTIDVKHNFEDVYLTGANRDESTWYLNAFGDYFKLDIVDDHPIGLELSATQIRKLMFENRDESFELSSYGLSQISNVVPPTTMLFLPSYCHTQTYVDLCKEYEFIKRYQESWSKAPYAPTFVTTDACVIQSGHVLVNIRDNFPGKGLWALPGGFLEQDEKAIDGCIRELFEETNIGLSKAQLYGSIQDKEVFDKPDRSLRGRTITICYLLKLDDSKPLPKIKPQAGEVRKCMWVPIAEAVENRAGWFEDHHAILLTMLGRIKT